MADREVNLQLELLTLEEGELHGCTTQQYAVSRSDGRSCRIEVIEQQIASVCVDDAVIDSLSDEELGWLVRSSLLCVREKFGGYIYCLDDQQGHYKIGRTRRLNKRILQLSAQPPFPVKVIFAHHVPFPAQTERAIHRHFKDKRVRGEWFALNDDDLNYLRQNCERIMGA